MTSVGRNYLTLTAHQKPTVGDMKTSAVNIDHMGWLKCDGRGLTVADYYWLWQVIGYSHGGSGNTFNLPAAAGRVPGFIGQSVGSNWALGDLSGEEKHTLTIAEMPTHNHSNVTDLSGTGISVNSNGAHTHTQTTVNDDYNNSSSYPNYTKPSYPNYDGAGSVTWTDTINSAGTHTHTLTDPTHNHRIKNQGGSNAHNNMQPTIFVGNMFIYSGKSTKVPNNNFGNYPYFAGGIF